MSKARVLGRIQKLMRGRVPEFSPSCHPGTLKQRVPVDLAQIFPARKYLGGYGFALVLVWVWLVEGGILTSGRYTDEDKGALTGKTKWSHSNLVLQHRDNLCSSWSNVVTSRSLL